MWVDNIKRIIQGGILDTITSITNVLNVTSVDTVDAVTEVANVTSVDTVDAVTEITNPVDTYTKDPVTGDYTIMDTVFTAPVFITPEHHEMHEGDHYFLKQVVPFDGAADEVGYFMFTTPVSPVRIHARAEFYGNVEFEVEIDEGSTYTLPGSEVDTWNNDRDSPNTAGITAYANPTEVVDGTRIWISRFGSGKDSTGVSPVFGYEIIAKANTVYTFKITKIAVQTGYIDAGFWFYEHTPDN